MNEHTSAPFEYNPGFFELPFKKAAAGKPLTKGWLQIVVWLVVGGIFLLAFIALLIYSGARINLFTAFYFVGGLGWVPATMCGLSHAYYKMCQKIYVHLDVQNESELTNFYKSTSTLIFGYLGGGLGNVVASIIIWLLMLVTVIMNNAAFSGENVSATRVIYIFYLFVGIVFTIVPCAAFHFIRTLRKLKKFKLKKSALYCGGADCIHVISRNCVLLVCAIVVLLGFLAFAMLRSPYQETLWVWLPPFGVAPLLLFVHNYQLKRSLIGAAFEDEEKILQGELRTVLNSISDSNNGLQYVYDISALLELQNKLKTYCYERSVLSTSMVLFFTAIGSIGSVVAALVPITEFIRNAAY